MFVCPEPLPLDLVTTEGTEVDVTSLWEMPFCLVVSCCPNDCLVDNDALPKAKTAIDRRSCAPVGVVGVISSGIGWRTAIGRDAFHLFFLLGHNSYLDGAGCCGSQPVPHISLLEGTIYCTIFLADEEGIDDEPVAKAGVYPIHQRISIKYQIRLL